MNETIVRDFLVMRGDNGTVTLQPLDKADGPAMVMTAEEFAAWKARPHENETPGGQYVAEYILPEYCEPDMEGGVNTSFIAEEINAGGLLVCPKCHFVRLPRHPFSWGDLQVGDTTDPGESVCDVCFTASKNATYLEVDLAVDLENAAEEVIIARNLRAAALSYLWISSAAAADALIKAAMAQGYQSPIYQKLRYQRMRDQQLQRKIKKPDTKRQNRKPNFE